MKGYNSTLHSCRRKTEEEMRTVEKQSNESFSLNRVESSRACEVTSVRESRMAILDVFGRTDSRVPGTTRRRGTGNAGPLRRSSSVLSESECHPREAQAASVSHKKEIERNTTSNQNGSRTY